MAKCASDEVNEKHPYRQLWLDQYSGNILHQQTAATRSAGDVFQEWLYPLHSGEAFGVLGKLIILLSGFMPLVLFITGVIRWLEKRHAAR